MDDRASHNGGAPPTPEERRERLLALYDMDYDLPVLGLVRIVNNGIEAEGGQVALGKTEVARCFGVRCAATQQDLILRAESRETMGQWIRHLAVSLGN